MNKQKDCIVSFSHDSEVSYLSLTKYLTSLMMIGVVASNSERIHPWGLKPATGQLLQTTGISSPWKSCFSLGEITQDTDYVFEYKTIKMTQQCLKSNMTFQTKDFLLLQSPHHNHLDYKMWTYVERRVCKVSR